MTICPTPRIWKITKISSCDDHNPKFRCPRYIIRVECGIELLNAERRIDLAPILRPHQCIRRALHFSLSAPLRPSLLPIPSPSFPPPLACTCPLARSSPLDLLFACRATAFALGVFDAPHCFALRHSRIATHTTKSTFDRPLLQNSLDAGRITIRNSN